MFLCQILCAVWLGLVFPLTSDSGRGLLAKFLGFRKGTSIGFVLNSDEGKTFGFAKLTFWLQMQSIKLEYYKIYLIFSGNFLLHLFYECSCKIRVMGFFLLVQSCVSLMMKNVREEVSVVKVRVG